MIRRLNNWIKKPDPGNVPFDPISHVFFVLNKAMGVYVLVPTFIVIGVFWVLD